MATTHVQSKASQSGTGASSLTCTFTAPAASGSGLIVAVAGSGGLSAPTWTITDDKSGGSNSYATFIGTRTIANTSNVIQLFMCTASGGAVSVITATPSLNVTISMAIMEVVGQHATTPKSTHNAGASGTSTTPDSGAPSWSGDGVDFGVTAVMDYQDLSAQTVSYGSGWSAGDKLGSDGAGKLSIGLSWFASPSATEHGTWTLANSANWICAVAGVIPAAATDPSFPIIQAVGNEAASILWNLDGRY